jgi:hypothetical protein
LLGCKNKSDSIDFLLACNKLEEDVILKIILKVQSESPFQKKKGPLLLNKKDFLSVSKSNSIYAPDIADHSSMKRLINKLVNILFTLELNKYHAEYQIKQYKRPRKIC